MESETIDSGFSEDFFSDAALKGVYNALRNSLTGECARTDQLFKKKLIKINYTHPGLLILKAGRFGLRLIARKKDDALELELQRPTPHRAELIAVPFETVDIFVSSDNRDIAKKIASWVDGSWGANVEHKRAVKPLTARKLRPKSLLVSLLAKAGLGNAEEPELGWGVIANIVVAREGEAVVSLATGWKGRVTHYVPEGNYCRDGQMAVGDTIIINRAGQACYYKPNQGDISRQRFVLFE